MLSCLLPLEKCANQCQSHRLDSRQAVIYMLSMLPWFTAPGKDMIREDGSTDRLWGRMVELSHLFLFICLLLFFETVFSL